MSTYKKVTGFKLHSGLKAGSELPEPPGGNYVPGLEPPGGNYALTPCACASGCAGCATPFETAACRADCGL